MVRSQARWASKPSAVSSEGSEPGAGTWAASHARASSRNSSWAGVNRRSIGVSMVGFLGWWPLAVAGVADRPGEI